MMATLGTKFPAITAITILVFEVKAAIRSVFQLTLNDLLVGAWGNLRALSIYEKKPEISVVAKVEFPIGKKFCKGLWLTSIFYARNVTKTTTKPSNVSAH